VKLLGVIIDNRLTFGAQVTSICKKVNSKTFLLNKSLYLFTENFKPILFKLFIQSQFDYCSSLIMHLDTTHRDKLAKCFAKSIHRVLKIKIFSLTLDEQYTKLLSIKILPLAFRQYFRFCTFLHGTIKNNNSILANTIKANLSTTSTRNKYSELSCKKNFKKFSFVSISLKLLNIFVAEHLSRSQDLFKTFLKQNISSQYTLAVNTFI